MLSSAWVRYVQALKRPTPGMIYAYPGIETARVDAAIRFCSRPPPHRRFSAYLSETAQLNPIYAQLRDAAWARLRQPAT